MTNAELVAKLEAATEGSRELDYAVEMSRYDPETMYALNLKLSGDLPHYTTSLDAALTLVPEGYCWSIGFAGRTIANVWKTPTPSKGGTPALALCIAALKARESAG